MVAKKVLSQQWICPKCGFKKLTDPEVVRLESKWRFSYFFANAYICDNCGYIELYKSREQA